MIESILFDTLPEKVCINGRMCSIGYGYRAHMAIEIEMFSENSDEQKLLNALNLFYPDGIPARTKEEWNQAIEYMLWFHRGGGEDEQEQKKQNRPGRHRTAARGYCFEQDAPLIYAAFLEQYQINLRKTPNRELHWWEFLALFQALDENTLLAKVMYWRTCSLSGLPDSRKKFITKMRGLYALKDAESSMDSKTKLAKRNAEMLAYVRKRLEDVEKGK